MLRQTFIYLCKMDDPGLVYAHDALIAKKMNRGEGGKQSPVMALQGSQVFF